MQAAEFNTKQTLDFIHQNVKNNYFPKSSKILLNVWLMNDKKPSCS